MIINLSELYNLEGKEKTYTAEIEMTELKALGGVYEIAAKEPVMLRIRNLGGRKLLLEGNVRLTLRMPCNRCLKPVSCPFDVSFSEELDKNPTEETHPYVNGYSLDVEQLLLYELIPDLPMRILCQEDCQGICNQCGTNRNEQPCNCDQRVPDPRMAGIENLFKQFYQE